MIDLKIGDCLERLKDIEDNSVDMILTDPPYEIGFMSRCWDNTGIAFNVDMWREAMRVLKPGGYLMAFSGTRTYHRMAVAIEDAGFEVKDMIEYIYGSGFPKAHDISKAIDRKLGLEREIIGEKMRPDGRTMAQTQPNGFVPQFTDYKTDKINAFITAPASDIVKQYEGYKTQLKPSHEPICLAMKPLSEKTFADNVMKWGTGGLNIDDCRISTNEELRRSVGGFASKSDIFNNNEKYKINTLNNSAPEGRFPANLIIHENITDVLDSQSGYSKSRKLKEDTGSETTPNGIYGNYNKRSLVPHNDEGGASRYFKNIEEEDTYIPFIYHAKASKKDRNIDINGEQITGELKSGGVRKGMNNNKVRPDGSERKEILHINNHATVKPTGLMKYLLKMGLPPIHNAVVLDIFAGSGSTGVALEMLNKEEGKEHKCILIEREAEYAEIIKKRCCLK